MIGRPVARDEKRRLDLEQSLAVIYIYIYLWGLLFRNDAANQSPEFF